MRKCIPFNEDIPLNWINFSFLKYQIFTKIQTPTRMPSKKVTFPNPRGQELSARLELPVNQKPHTCALFAHCFTCSKNLHAVRHISRALNQAGIAVLRFDFTGLGESEGDFADTNFSSNIEDLVAAAHFMETCYDAPSILIGHSLGGAAVISAAAQLPDIKAIATIGAPFDPGHVKHLFADDLEEIKTEGEAEVTIGGRPFKVKKQFLEDIQEQILVSHLNEMNKPLLLLHSPQDDIVAIKHAARIYHAAQHPKSFISLEGADHLLNRKEDAHYVGGMIACWVQKYLNVEKKEALKAEKQVATRLGPEGYTTEVMVRHHSLTADEPVSVGGNDYGPSPYELVSAGLGACTAMTLHMYARRKKWPLKNVTVHLSHFKDYAKDMELAEEVTSKIDHFERLIEIEGELSEAQRQRLLEIANKCPVHKTMHNPVEVHSTLKE